MIALLVRFIQSQFPHVSHFLNLLKKDDLPKRRKIDSKVTKTLTDKFWEEDISFYIEGAGFKDK